MSHDKKKSQSGLMMSQEYFVKLKMNSLEGLGQIGVSQVVQH